MKPSKENDKIRKQFRKVYQTKQFPLLNNEDMKRLESLIINYDDFKEDIDHKSGTVILNNYRITFEIKEKEKVIKEKYLLLSCADVILK